MGKAAIGTWLLALGLFLPGPTVPGYPKILPLQSTLKNKAKSRYSPFAIRQTEALSSQPPAISQKKATSYQPPASSQERTAKSQKPHASAVFPRFCLQVSRAQDFTGKVFCQPNGIKILRMSPPGGGQLPATSYQLPAQTSPCAGFSAGGWKLGAGSFFLAGGWELAAGSYELQVPPPRLRSGSG